MSNEISETNTQIAETAPVSEAFSGESSNDETQFFNDLKEKYSSIISKFVGQITLEFVNRYGDSGSRPIKNSLRMAFAKAHEVVAEMVAESKEFAASMDYDAVKF